MGGSSSTEAKADKNPKPVSTEDAASKAPEKSKDEVQQLKKAAREENKEYSERLRFISQVPLLKRLPRDQHPLLVANMEIVNCTPEQVIMTEGEAGSEMFIIQSGEASVYKNVNGATTKVRTLGAGDYFGEQALRFNDNRSATVIAGPKLVALKMTRDRFQQLGLSDKLQFANRKAVGGGGFMQRQVEVKPPSPKTAEEEELIKKALTQNENLGTVVSLDEERVKQLINVTWKLPVSKGTEIIVEGDLAADYFYVVQDGSFEIRVSDEDQPADSEGNASKYVSSVGKGGSFGELALLYLGPRASTVKAEVDSVVWVIDRHNFKQILMKTTASKIAEYQKYLDSVQVLEPLLAEEKLAVAEALVEMHFAKDETILKQGEQGNTFYVLYEGEVSVQKDGKEIARPSATGGASQVFGERALLENEPRAATVVVVSDEAKVLALDRDSFNFLLGPLKDILSRPKDSRARAKTMLPGKAMRVLTTRGQINREDLMRVGLLGCGGFGAVELQEHKKTGETYAMKTLSKGYVVKTGMQDSVMAEKNILLMTDSPFIIKLHATYNGTQNLYFLLEVALGGELYATYNKKGWHGSEPHCMYYTAGVVFAFTHLHERRIIYRDLKPENLLLTEAGHIKLTDMGLAKFVIGKTYTTCGTPDYFAPELIRSQGHTNAVDWWTLGILIYELMSGHPPFEAPQPMKTYSKVMKGISHVTFPSKCQGAVGDLIKGLLQRDPSERLPMKQGGIKNMQQHQWYLDTKFDWEKFENLSWSVPYKPQVKSPKDIANFNARKEDMPKTMEYKDDGSGWDKDFAS